MVRKIVEEEQKGKNRAEYGKYIIQNLSKELQEEFGKGFNTTNLKRMKLFLYNISKRCDRVAPINLVSFL